nr:stress response protein NST1-like [Aedes albopictus]
MDTKNFVKYVTKILFPFLIKRGVKFPVIFFVDGHKSHMAIESADACKRLGIILIALIPNATRILQPADVGVFKPLKTRWFQVVQNWKLNHKFAEVTVKDFGTLLESAMKLALTTSTIITAFAACGLYPFNPDAVDYTKCIAESYQDSYDASGPSDTIPNGVVAEEPPKADLVVPYGIVVEALDMLGPEKVRLYSDENSENLSHEDRVLSFVYKNILRCSNNGSAASDAEMTVDSLMLDEGCSGDELRQNTSGYEVTEQDEDNLLGTGIINNQIINAQQLNIEFTTSPDLTGKTESHISTPEAPRLADFLDAPDVLKRSSKHVNYQMQSHAVLTADERLQAIILKENQRDEAERLKKEKAEQRALQKAKLEEQKNAKRELKLKRKAEKEVEMQKKMDEKKRKAEIKQRKQLENEAKNFKMRKPSLKFKCRVDKERSSRKS